MLILLIILTAISSIHCQKIVNGLIADRIDFQFQAAILLKQRDQRELFLCGGSVIDQRVILTAAHCLWNVERAIVILGAADLLVNETGTSQFLLNETAFKVHPKFNLAYAFMDVGLVTLPEAIEFNNVTQPVALPSQFMLDESYAGDIGTIAGYGQFCDTCGSSSVLRYTKNRILGNDECSSFVGLFPTPTQICVSTAENKSSACRGDSGGALTILRNNVTVQIGISSFGPQKCENGLPAVFTRLNKEIVEWIEGEVDKVYVESDE